MSSEFGINNDIAVGSRTLHIQSNYSKEKQRISVTLFDQGSVVNKREFPIGEEEVPEIIEEQVKQFHDLIKTDVELLFHMAESVRSSNHLPSIIHLGQLFLERGFHQEAIEQFEYAKTVGGNEVDTDVELSRAYFNKGDYSTASLQLTAALSKYPDYPDLHLLLGKTYWKQQKFALGKRHFIKAIELNENYWDAYFSQAYYLVDSTLDFPTHPELGPPIERINEAEELFLKAIRINPNINDELMTTGLELLRNNKQIEKALVKFDQAREEQIQGKLFDSEFYLKFMFGQLDSDYRTLDYYIQTIEKVLQKNPDYADLRHSLGIAYLLKGWQCFSKSTSEFEKAVEINPEYEKAKTKLRLMQNDGRGLLILLRAILK